MALVADANASSSYGQPLTAVKAQGRVTIMEGSRTVATCYTASPNIDQTRPILYATVLVLLILTFALNVVAILVRAKVRRQLRAMN